MGGTLRVGLREPPLLSKILCIACGHQHEAVTFGVDPFAIRCPRCGNVDSHPIELEASLLEDEAWTDEEAAVLYS